MKICFRKGLLGIFVEAEDMKNAFLILCELKDHCIYKRCLGFQITFPTLQYSLNIIWHDFKSAVMPLITLQYLSLEQSLVNKPKIIITPSNELSQIKSKTDFVSDLVSTSLDWVPTPFNQTQPYYPFLICKKTVL
jgi:hypothetical protein